MSVNPPPPELGSSSCRSKYQGDVVKKIKYRHSNTPPPPPLELGSSGSSMNDNRWLRVIKNVGSAYKRELCTRNVYKFLRN